MIAEDPIARFLAALAHARATEPFDATAMALATADARGRPSARMVLLKEAGPRGFVFFTNGESRKGDELTANPFAALAIHWPKLEQQVRVEGRVEAISAEESDAYFKSRPRGSQIGAWASQQSRPLGSREELTAATRAVEERFPGVVPRPPHWGGYRVVPERIEFWQGRADRLHDREVFVREGDDWKVTRLYP